MLDDEHASHGEDCPICRGEELSPVFVAILKAASAEPSERMTRDECLAWLSDL